VRVVDRDGSDLIMKIARGGAGACLPRQSTQRRIAGHAGAEEETAATHSSQAQKLPAIMHVQPLQSRVGDLPTRIFFA